MGSSVAVSWVKKRLEISGRSTGKEDLRQWRLIHKNQENSNLRETLGQKGIEAESLDV